MPRMESVISTRLDEREALNGHIARLNDREAEYKRKLELLPDTYPVIPGDRLSGLSTEPERRTILKVLDEVAQQKAKIPGMEAAIRTADPDQVAKMEKEIESLKSIIADIARNKPNGNGNVSEPSTVKNGKAKQG